MVTQPGPKKGPRSRPFKRHHAPHSRGIPTRSVHVTSRTNRMAQGLRQQTGPARCLRHGTDPNPHPWPVTPTAGGCPRGRAGPGQACAEAQGDTRDRGSLFRSLGILVPYPPFAGVVPQSHETTDPASQSVPHRHGAQRRTVKYGRRPPELDAGCRPPWSSTRTVRGL